MAKNSAYIGLAGPFGYAYAHQTQLAGAGKKSPNAVLENVSGLLICYDDLYFLSKHLCPADMWDLPYVHFVMEDDDTAALAATAIQQASEISTEELPSHKMDFGRFGEISKAMHTGSNVNMSIDNHSSSIDLQPNLQAMGDAARALNIVSDIFVTQALSLSEGDLDLIISSPALGALTQTQSEAHGIKQGFDHPKLSLVAELVTVHTQNFLSSTGSYHESYEELRNHDRVREFRDFLSSMDVTPEEATGLAAEVSRQAERFAGKALKDRVQRKSMFRSFGAPALKAVGNALHPFAGTTAVGSWELFLSRQEEAERKLMAWAPFVYDMQHKG